MNSSQTYNYVTKTIESRDVHFIRLWFVDVHGAPKSFATTPAEFPELMEKGLGFDGNCIRGFGGLSDSEVLAFPDLSTFQLLPWRPTSNAVARMFCNVVTPDGKPYAADSRHVLIEAIEAAHKMGYEMSVGCEAVYYYFKDDKGTEVLDHGGFFDLTSLDNASDLRRDTILTLEKMGVSVANSHHGRGASQHGIVLKDMDPLGMADAVMTFKQVVKEIATQHGAYASFMPKPMQNQPGSGLRLRLSLYDQDGENVFFQPPQDGEREDGIALSPTGRHFLAGLLKYAPEYALVTNQLVNSYKRLVPKSDAPFTTTWGFRNRLAMVRVPGYRPEMADTFCLELRSPDSAANPYLAFAVLMAAGLRGIRDRLQLEDPCDGVDLENLDRSTAAAQGIGMLPETLGDAIKAFAESDLMRETLGEHIHNYLVEAKKAEWASYRTQVSQWELDRYLEII